MRRRILFRPVDGPRGASTRYRVLAHLPALEKAGFKPRVRFPLSAGRGSRPAARWFRLADLTRDLVSPAREEILFVHRRTYPAAVVGALRRPGRKVVFDFDDAIDLPPPGRESNERDLARYRANFRATLGVADLVICGNRELASRVPAGETVIVPTPVDTARFRPGAVEPASGPAVGWVGYSDNLPYLEALSDPLREVARRHPRLRVVVAADRPPDLPGLNVEFRRWSLETEVSCFTGIGIGLMPLPDNSWTRGKCAYKALQYMALGFPAVASPVGMSAEVIAHGRTGFLPREGRDWVETLDLLLSRPDLAAEVGEAGRREVERAFSLRVISERMVELLRDPR